MSKNRFQFDENSHSEYEEDLEHKQNMYFEEEEKKSSSSLFGILPWMLMSLLIISISFYAWWEYKKSNDPEKNLLKLPGSSLSDDFRIQTEAGLLLPKRSKQEILSQGMNLYKQGKYHKARAKFRAALKLYKTEQDKSICYIYLGAMDYDQAHYSSAIRNFNKALQTKNFLFMAYTNLAKAYRSLGYASEAVKAAAKAKELKPADVNANLLMGNLQSDTGNIDGAVHSYQKGLNDDPDNVLLLYNLAVSYLKQGKATDSADYFKKVISASPASNLAYKSHSHLGSFYYERSQYEKAKLHYLKALNLNPNSPKLLYNMGLLSLKNKQKQSALDYFKKALSKNSNSSELYRRLAKALESLNYYNLALSALDKALEISPVNIKTLFIAGSLHYKVGSLPAAENTYRKIIKNSASEKDKLSALNNLGIILDEQSRFYEAEEIYEQALSIDSSSENTLYNLGLLYENSGKPDKAIQTWKKAIQIYPEKGQFRKVIADYYYKKGYLKEALKQYEKYVFAIENKPGNKENLSYSYLQMGIILQKENSMGEAKNYYLKVIKNSRQTKLKQKAHLMLALIYADSANFNLDEAKKEVYKGININPQNTKAKIVLAKVLLKSPSANDRETAIDELRAITASEEPPSLLAQAFNLLGQHYFKNGEFKRSVLAFNNALDLNPADEASYKYLKIAEAKLNNSY